MADIRGFREVKVTTENESPRCFVLRVYVEKDPGLSPEEVMLSVGTTLEGMMRIYEERKQRAAKR